MRKAISLVAAVVVGMAVASVFNVNQWVSAQQRPAKVPLAAVPGEKGGQDIWGAYEPVPNWPKHRPSRICSTTRSPVRRSAHRTTA